MTTKKSTKKATVKKAEKVEEAPQKVTYINPTGAGLKGRKNSADEPQVVATFDDNRKSKHTQKAICSYTIYRAVLNLKAKAEKIDAIATLKKAASLIKAGKHLEAYNLTLPLRISSTELIEYVKKHTGIDLSSVFKGRFPDSPLHRGMHACSKQETNQSRTDKATNRLKDTFARGARGLILRDSRVGPGTKGFYYPNPLFDYELQNITEADGKARSNELVRMIKQ